MCALQMGPSYRSRNSQLSEDVGPLHGPSMKHFWQLVDKDRSRHRGLTIWEDWLDTSNERRNRVSQEEVEFVHLWKQSYREYFIVLRIYIR